MENSEDFFEKLKALLDQKGSLFLEDVNITVDQLKAHISPVLQQAQMQAMKKKLPDFKWVSTQIPPLPPKSFHPIEEIEFSRSNGRSVKIGGDKTLPYLTFLQDKHGKILKNPNSPVVTFDVFDMKIKLPKVIKNAYREVLTDPAGWAELAEKYGADLITMHFVSTDPGVNDTPVSKARQILEDVLERVKCPVIIGGSGNKKKDTELFEELGAITQGERLMLSSADKITIDKVVPIARKYEHNVLLWAQLDINDQSKLVEDALSMGIPRNQIVLDPTCATLGYGLEYSYSIYQQIRLAGLKGDSNLNFPLSAGTTNAWGARESHMKKINHVPNHGGNRFLRGPIWEITTALAMSLVGLNLAMMLHPLSAQIFKEMVNDLSTVTFQTPDNYLDWVSAKY
ncbi:hypothetical protein NEF87_003955 [Candidatus Lokiarchaeum ossiferum]|uniref:CO dehydrogenase/acetyl-CoA synthase delta subunit TIM barrel domain-containing protein n=1 Tax=Candidatus Lokiarchaeum ossiferum TaxID=2951803 RepID=A0ABY6HVY4_9ARCH|nr:hypothetical protein NEF87_003955 [Candidatus Lokiarchaeum sp. B-35]